MNVKNMVKYREIWMGIAILWIVLFHSGINVSNMNLAFVKQIGYGGVDIFFLASGIGCFYSLENNSDVFKFIKRRILRIIPTYWTFMIGWILYHKIYDEISLRTILGNILCVRNFTHLGGDFNWYISAIWLMYLLAPLFKSMVDEIESAYKVGGIIAFLVLFSICFWDSKVYIITVTRLPIFFIGMYVGKMARNEVRVNKKEILFLLVAEVIGLGILWYWLRTHTDDLWQKGYYWYLFILITPGLCIVISFIMEFLKGKAKYIVEKIFGTIGKYSFEIYLLHIWFFEILENNLLKNEIVPNRISVWLITLILLIPGCIILRKMQYIGMSILKKMWNRLSK